jgi:tRNA (guanine-N7-)-methyltransferase
MDSRHIKSYVLRTGRFSASQKRSYNAAGDFIIPFQDTHADLPVIFGNNRPITLEIGFGMGLATAVIAAENPDKNYLGIEVHRPGIGRLLWEIEQRSLSNIRIIEYDAAVAVGRMIPDSSLDAVHVFFPDPWPKQRHHKRRLMQRPFTDTLCRALKPDGYLYMVTDWDDYGNYALSELSATDGLVNAYSGFAPPQTWRPRTGFEQKGLDKNHVIRELYFIKT